MCPAKVFNQKRMQAIGGKMNEKLNMAVIYRKSPTLQVMLQNE